MTKAEIVASAIAALREEPAPVRVTQDELGRYFDDGYEEICELTGAIHRTFQQPVDPNQHFVPIPNGTLFIISLYDVVSASDRHVIDPVPWREIQVRDGFFIRRTGSRPELYAPWGMAEILLNRAYTAPGVLEFTVAEVPDFLADNTSPAFQSEYHEALVEYLLFRAGIKDATTGEQLGRGMRHRKFYRTTAARLMGYSAAKHSNLSTRFSVGARRIP